MQNVTELEAGKLPLREITSHAELAAAGFPGIPNAQQIGEGYSSHVYAFDYSHGALVIPAVLKVYDRRTGDWALEEPALKLVSDLPEPAQPLFKVERSVLGYVAIAKERIFGEDMADNQELFPARREAKRDNGEQEEKAKWIIGFLEFLGKIHQRGLVMGDFKSQDALWDRKNQKVRIIDFGNAFVKGSLHDPGSYGKGSDILRMCDIFLANTQVGNTIGVYVDSYGLPKLPYLWQKTYETAIEECRKTGTVPELPKLVSRFLRNEPGEVGQIIDEMKNYFHAIGLQVESDTEYVMRRYGKEFAEFKQYLAVDLDNPKYSLGVLQGAMIFCPGAFQTPDQDVVARVFQEKGREFVLAHYQTYPGEEGEVAAINRYMLTKQRETIISLHDQLFPEAKIGDPQKPFQSRDERMVAVLGIKRTELLLERLKLYKGNALSRGDKIGVEELEKIRKLEEQRLVELKERPREIKRKELEEIKNFISQFEASIIDPKAVADLWDNQSGGVAIALGFYSYWIGKYNLIKELFESQFRNFSWKEYEQVSPGFWGRLIRQKPGIPKSEETVITGYLDRKGIKKDSPDFPKEMKRIFIARLQIYQALARLDDKVKFDKVIEDCS